MTRLRVLFRMATLLAITGCTLRPAARMEAAARSAAPEPHREVAEAAARAETAPTAKAAEIDEEASGDDEPPDDPAGDEPGSDEEATRDDPAPTGTSQAPAMRYGRLGQRSCEAELRKRKIGFVRVETARGVVAPVRLTGPLSGVTFRANLPAAKRKTAVIEIYDCRLVLALDDFAKILARHDIEEVIHLSVYRPVSKKRKLKNGVGRRHGAALAIDAAIFKTKDGRTLDVKKDFDGKIRRRTCPPPKAASELRILACEASDARIFNVLLTPNYNRAHKNHFHLEVTAGAKWFYLR